MYQRAILFSLSLILHNSLGATTVTPTPGLAWLCVLLQQKQATVQNTTARILAAVTICFVLKLFEIVIKPTYLHAEHT